jgi:hypothetical protein
LAAERGLLNLSPSHALELLDFILTQQPGLWIAGIDRLHPNIAWQYVQEPYCYERGTTDETSAVQHKDQMVSAPQRTQFGAGNGEADTLARTRKEHPTAGSYDVSQRLRQVWCEALKLDEVNDDENFFDLGGHSLIVPRLLEQINARLCAGIQTVDVFRYPTIRTLSQRILELLSKPDLDPQRAGSLW